MLLVSGLIFTGNMYAQTVEELKAAAKTQDMSTWSFPTSTSKFVTIDGVRYSLDDNNKVAQVEAYSSNEVAPANVEIPETVKYSSKTYVVVSVNGSSSYHQNNTTSITLPSTLRLIKQNAFSQYKKVSLFTIPESVEKIEGGAFNNLTNTHIRFLSTTPPDLTGNFNTSSASDAKHVRITVPAASFREYHIRNYYINSCVISDDLSVSTVNTGKVDNGELGYVVVSDRLPNDVRTYSDVNVLVINEGTIDKTDWYAMRQMPNLVKVDMSGLSITEVPEGALKNCWQIETVILPESIEKIYNDAFYQTDITDFKFPSELKSIGTYAFYECDSLKEAIFNNKLTTISSYSFGYCDSLKTVKFPQTLTSIGTYAFYYCNLDSIDVPGSVKTLTDHCFSENVNMRYVKFNEGLTYINSYAFSYDQSVAQIIFPSTVRTVGSYAFNNCTGMIELILNEGLTEINTSTFGNCSSLTDVVLPSSLEFCLSSPFNGCTKLNRIETRALIPPTVRSKVPTSSAGSRTLAVPLWSFQEYATTPGWLEYQDHMVIDTTILPQNIVINKDFEFVLDDNDNVENYVPNIKMSTNTEMIDDGFGNTRYERGNLTISSRSKMAINDFSMFYSPYAKYFADESWFYGKRDYEYYQTEYNPNTLLVRGQMRAENQTLHLMLRCDAWQFICFPFDVKVSDIVPDDSKTQWVVRSYSGYQRAQKNFSNTWVNLTADSILQAGKGYIMRCYNTDNTNNGKPVYFTVTPIIESLTRQYLFTSEDRLVALEQHISEFEQNRSWNLIGNPYPTFYDTRYLDTEAPFMVWDSYNRSYAAFSPIDDKYVLTPGEAFFVQCPVESDGLLFLKGGRQTYRNPNDLTVDEQQLLEQAPMRRESAKPRRVYNFTFENDEFSDRTRVVFNEKAAMGYEMNRDAAKFEAMEAATPEIWSMGDGISYSINERPEGNASFALAVRCGTDGFYTISLNTTTGDKVILEDCVDNRKMNLSEGSYTFSAKAGTYESRFIVTVQAAGTTAAEAITTDKSDDAPAYNAAGQRTNAEEGIIIRNGKKTFEK